MYKSESTPPLRHFLYLSLVLLVIPVPKSQAQESDPWVMLEVIVPSAEIKDGDNVLSQVNQGAFLFPMQKAKTWYSVFDPHIQRSGWIREKDVQSVSIFRNKEDFELAKASDESANQAMENNQWEQAAKVLKKLLELQQTVTTENTAVAMTCDTIAFAYLNNGEFEKALPFARQGLEASGQCLPRNHVQNARSNLRLGTVYLELGENAKSLSYLQSALAICKKLKQDSKLELSILRELVLIETGDELEKHFREGLALSQKVYGPDDPLRINFMRDLASDLMNSKLNDRREIFQLLEQACKASTKNGDQLQIAVSLRMMAYFKFNVAEERAAGFDDAARLIEEAIEITDKSVDFSDKHEEMYIRELAGQIYSSLGEDGKAEVQYLKTILIARNLNEYNYLISTLSSLCFLQTRMTKFSDAEQSGLEAIELAEEHFPDDAGLIAGPQNMLAGVYSSLGQYSEAKRLYEASIGSEGDKADLYLVHNAADFYAKVGNYELAKKLHRQILAERERDYGLAHNCTQASLSSLADVYLKMQDPEESLELLERAFKVRKDSNVEEFKGSCTPPDIHLQLGVVHTALEDFDQAKTHLEISQRRTLQRFGKNSKKLIDVKAAFMELELARGNASGSRTTIEEAAQLRRRELADLLPTLSQGAQATYLRENFRDSFETALSYGLVASGDQLTATKSAGWLINGKGLGQEVLAESALLSKPEALPIVSELKSVRSELARFALGSLGEISGTKRQRIANLESKEQDLQRELSKFGLGSQTGSRWVSTGTLRSQIPDKSVMVNIARFRPRRLNRPGPPSWDAERYVAWVIPTEGFGRVNVVDLGLAETVDLHVELVRREFEMDTVNRNKANQIKYESKSREILTKLSKLVLQPLEKHIDEFSEIILSPDANLWAIPWSAMPRSDQRYLVESHELTHVLSGRELVFEVSENSLVSGPVIFADPDYDMGAEDILGRGSYADKGTRSVVDAWFPRLEKTAEEAKWIKLSIEGSSNEVARVLLQSDAQELTFKQLHRPRLLVVSTHGYFLKADEQGEFGSTVLDDPLLRCGLAFAGSNNRKQAIAQGQEDGLLTGIEIVSVDLRGTELVVLSACETGLGDISSGEGVAGLTQAFQMAGAESVLSSLWKVNNLATKDLMEDFFRRLADGDSKSAALRKAQLTRIETRQSRYGAAHPYYWAAFGLTGR